jgi:phosphate transport system substrate-binding protein
VSAAERPEVDAFMRFYLDVAPQLAADVGYVALPDRAYELARRRYAQRRTGAPFSGDHPGQTLTEIVGHGL